MNDIYTSRAIKVIAIKTIDAAASLGSVCPQTYEASKSTIVDQLKKYFPSETQETYVKNGHNLAWVLGLDHKHEFSDKLIESAISLAGQALALEVRYQDALATIRRLEAEVRDVRAKMADSKE